MDEGVLNSGQDNSLISEIENAISDLNKGKTRLDCNKLGVDCTNKFSKIHTTV